MVDINKMRGSANRQARKEAEVAIHPSTRPIEKKSKNVIVRLTESEHRRLREATFREGTSIQAVVSGMIREYIEEPDDSSVQ